MYAIGINLFIVPIGLYSGGIYGICQLVRTFLSNYYNFGSIDIAGILYMLVNIPLLILAIKSLGKKFFFSTIISVIISNMQCLNDYLSMSSLLKFAAKLQYFR